jgi:2-oxoglutarate ferredoxin oxidoreductase subunit alpha
VARLRSEGLRVGLLRPLTLWPFPSAWLRAQAGRVRHFMAVELSCGQMVEDVRLAVGDAAAVSLYGRSGGGVMTVDELCTAVRQVLTRE